MNSRKIPQNLYKKIVENIPFCCVDMVVHCKGLVLLLKRKNKPARGVWWLPGGRIYKNETLEHAALRKVYEETGIKSRIKKRIGVYETLFRKGPFKDLKTGIHTVNICFLVEPVSRNVDVRGLKGNVDYTEYKWISKLERNMHWYTKKVIKDSGVL